jgi:carotenoid cleavage oxygenase
VIYDLPVTFDLDSLQSGDGAGFPYAWNPDYPARVGVMSRDGDGSDVRWFDVEPCYVYHPLNAYDDGSDRIVLDVVRHPQMFATDRQGPNEGPPTLDRWTVDTSGDKVLEDRLDDRGQEFPRVDERLTGRRHRFGYAPAVGTDAGDIDLTGSLLKHDLVAGRTEVRSFGPSRRAGEFVFVPAGPDAAEDEGVLMGFVHDDESGRTDLALIDATTLEDVAQVHLPVRVPYGFHGNWIPA